MAQENLKRRNVTALTKVTSQVIKQMVLKMKMCVMINDNRIYFIKKRLLYGNSRCICSRNKV